MPGRERGSGMHSDGPKKQKARLAASLRGEKAPGQCADGHRTLILKRSLIKGWISVKQESQILTLS
jgi:hypothetical protein